MKLQSTDALRERFSRSTPAKPSQAEALTAQQFRRMAAVVEMLRDNWDGCTIVVPLPANIINGSLHWAHEKTLKQQYYGYLQQQGQLGLLPKPPQPTPTLWRVAITVYSTKPMDDTNARAAVKWPEDFLKRSGWCIDDNEEHLEIVSFTRDIDRSTPRIEFRTVD